MTKEINEKQIEIVSTKNWIREISKARADAQAAKIDLKVSIADFAAHYELCDDFVDLTDCDAVLNWLKLHLAEQILAQDAENKTAQNAEIKP